MGASSPAGWSTPRRPPHHSRIGASPRRRRRRRRPPSIHPGPGGVYGRDSPTRNCSTSTTCVACSTICPLDRACAATSGGGTRSSQLATASPIGCAAQIRAARSTVCNSARVTGSPGSGPRLGPARRSPPRHPGREPPASPRRREPGHGGKPARQARGRTGARRRTPRPGRRPPPSTPPMHTGARSLRTWATNAARRHGVRRRRRGQRQPSARKRLAGGHCTRPHDANAELVASPSVCPGRSARNPIPRPVSPAEVDAARRAASGPELAGVSERLLVEDRDSSGVGRGRTWSPGCPRR